VNAPIFVPRLDVLPPAQRRLWDELGSVPHTFVLYAGTAVALHLGHRQSIDFDFFSDAAFVPVQLREAMPFLRDATIVQQAPNTLGARVERDGVVRLSFFGVPALRRLRPPLVASGNGVQIASLLDLAGTMAAAVQQRAEAKDYVDLDAILRDGKIDLPMALGAAAAIYGATFNPLPTLKALTYFDDGDLPRLPADVRGRLVAAAAAVEPDALPTIDEARR